MHMKMMINIVIQVVEMIMYIILIHKEEKYV